MNNDRKDVLPLPQVESDTCSLPGDLSMLDELFPSLGDGASSSNLFTNQLALLLNSFNSSDDEGSSGAPSLFNPLQLSPPRLNEFHALATANLISQTQEAIMQEYNITDIGLDSSYSQDKSENEGLPQCDTSKQFTVDINSHKNTCNTVESIVEDKSWITSDTTNNCTFTKLNSYCNEDVEAARFLEESANNIVVEQMGILEKSESCPVRHDEQRFPNPVISHTDSAANGLNFTTNVTSGENGFRINENNCSNGVDAQNANQKVCASSVEDQTIPSSLINKSDSSVNCTQSEIVSNGASNALSFKQQMSEVEQICKINGDNIETKHLKQKLLKYEQNRDSPLESNHCNTDPYTYSNGKPVIDGGIFMCRKCTKPFNTMEELQTHSINHQQYVCPYPGCLRTFKYRSHLGYHKKVHEKDKSLQCSECGKLFTKDQHLEVHMRTHTDNKPFTCSVCNKSFTTFGNLKNHTRLHTGERPYVCDYDGCDKRFAEMSSLKKHKVTHTGEKSYHCDICGKSFTQRSSKTYHMKKHKDNKNCSVAIVDSAKT
ncbi:Zinc finger E-box-binding homeobox 2 [Mactra antiquata]